MLARGQPFARLSRHGDLVTSLPLSFADDHLENERILFGNLANLDHVDLLGHARALVGRRLFGWPRCRKARLAPRVSPASAVSTRPPCKAGPWPKLIHACLSNIRSSRSRSHRPKRAASPGGWVATPNRSRRRDLRQRRMAPPRRRSGDDRTDGTAQTQPD